MEFRAQDQQSKRGNEALNKGFRLLFILGIVLLALAVIVELALSFGLAWLAEYDTAVMSTIYSLRNDNLTAFLSVFTQLGDVVASIITFVALCAWLIFTKHKGLLYFALASFLSGEALLWGMKFLLGRPRPETSIIPLPADPSFPSGHAFTSLMLCALIIAFICLAKQERPKTVIVGLICILLVLYVIAMGFSRIYLGVHWPSDVLEGWLLSSGWFCVCLSIGANRRQKHLQRVE